MPQATSARQAGSRPSTAEGPGPPQPSHARAADRDGAGGFTCWRARPGGCGPGRRSRRPARARRRERSPGACARWTTAAAGRCRWPGPRPSSRPCWPVDRHRDAAARATAGRRAPAGRGVTARRSRRSRRSCRSTGRVEGRCRDRAGRDELGRAVAGRGSCSCCPGCPRSVAVRVGGRLREDRSARRQGRDLGHRHVGQLRQQARDGAGHDDLRQLRQVHARAGSAAARACSPRTASARRQRAASVLIAASLMAPP